MTLSLNKVSSVQVNAILEGKISVAKIGLFFLLYILSGNFAFLVCLLNHLFYFFFRGGEENELSSQENEEEEEEGATCSDVHWQTHTR